jgi:hypothetical protein
MDGWDRIRRYLLEYNIARERDDQILVKVVSPKGTRSQVVSVHLGDNAEVVVQSSFAKLSELKVPLTEVLKIVSAESRFGFRLDNDYLVLINRCHLAIANPVNIDGVVTDMAIEADIIEMDLGVDGDGDNDRF